MKHSQRAEASTVFIIFALVMIILSLACVAGGGIFSQTVTSLTNTGAFDAVGQGIAAARSSGLIDIMLGR